MSWSIVLRQIAALKASVVGLDAQLASIEAHAKEQFERERRPRARIERPATCEKHRPEDCGRLNEEAIADVSGMGGAPTRLMCRGCGLDPHTSVTTTATS